MRNGSPIHQPPRVPSAGSPRRGGVPTDALAWLPFLLQTADPLFPTGAYAHSLGLEEIVRLGAARDEATLGVFLRAQIIPALVWQELPYLRFARDAALRENVDDLCALDREIGAWKLCRELREASIQLGRRRLKTLLQSVAAPSLVAQLAEFEKRIEANEASGHQLCVCGAQFAQTPLDAALAAYFYQALAAHCSAALKLIRIGQEGCQRVLRESLAAAAEVIERSETVEREAGGWFNPLLEIASMRHERTHERLFIS